MKSKLISLSAISASFVAIFLTIGSYLQFADLFMLVISSIFVLLPLYYNSYKGSILAFLVGGILAFLLSGLNYLSIIFPAYFVFAGIYPIIKCKMMDKNFNNKIGMIIGLVWAIIAFYGCYFYYTLIMKGILTGIPDWLYDYIIYGVGLIAIIFYFVFDRFVVVMRSTLNKYLTRIIK